MENLSASKQSEPAKFQAIRSDLNKQELSTGKPDRSPVFEDLVTGECENFLHYLNWLGLAKDPNLMVLSSLHHYYYDLNELKDVRTLVNLKTLNRIKQLNSFLHTIFRLLPPNARFLGCFEEDKNPEGVPAPIYKSVKLFNGILNFLDSRTDRRLTKNEVIRLLESHGFRVADMTEIHGITYFKSINTRVCIT